MVVNVGRVLSGKWEYVENEIRKVNGVVVEGGAVLKVIFENDCVFDFSFPSFSRLLYFPGIKRKELIHPFEKQI